MNLPTLPARHIAALQALLAASLLLLLAACDRRPLEVIRAEKVNVKVLVNWRMTLTPQFNAIFGTNLEEDINEEDIRIAREYYGGEPNGMTVMLWGQDTGDRIVRSVNGMSAELPLRPDTYTIIIFNDREEEFLPYMRLYDAASYHNIAMRLSHYTRSRAGGSAEQFIHYPEPIGVVVDTFTISRDVLLRDTTIFIPYESYMDAGDYESDIVRTDTLKLSEAATPMTVNLSIKSKVKHWNSIKKVEACISGLADGFYMSRVVRTSETGTMELPADSWELYRLGDDNDSIGVIVNKIATFGLPHGKELMAERDSADNILSFRFTLANDSVQQCDFKVGKDIRYLTPEGREAVIRYRQDLHHLSLELDLREVIVTPYLPGATGTGFDAKVADWEDGGTFDLGGF